MTKFVGEAINVRAGRKKSGYSAKDLQKNMEKFLETGVHPDMLAQRGLSSHIVHSLPETDPFRPHVFLDVTVDNKPAGRLVIELFDDVAPAAARHLLNRCQPGSAGCLAGAGVHKLLPGYALFVGKSAAAAFGAGTELARTQRLQHCEAGAVSCSRNGAEVAIALGKALALDETHQVVGRVTLGADLLQLLDDVPRAADDSPLMRIKVAKCGPTNAAGTHETLEEALAKETPEAAAARLKRESANTRSSVMEALQQGMSHKRSADEAGLGPGSSAAPAEAAAAAGEARGSSSAAAGSSRAAAAASAGAGAAASKAAPGAGGAQAAGAKRAKQLLDSLLGDDSESDGSSSSSEGEGE